MEEINQSAQGDISLSVLSETKKSRIELVRRGVDGQILIKKTLHQTGTPYPALLAHRFSGIPQIYSVQETPCDTIVYEEYLHGQTLADYLRQNGTVSDAQAADWIVQLCNILIPMHQCNLVHRDIKPSNLIVTPDNTLRLIDFDAARTFEAHKDADTVLLGTKGYAAPEQYGYAQTDARTDIYAIGTVMNQALTGALPKDIPYTGKLAAIISYCIQIDPQRRFKTCAALQNALRTEYAPAHPLHTEYPPPGIPQPSAAPTGKRHEWWRIVICVCLSVSAALLAFSSEKYAGIRSLWNALENVTILLPPTAFCVDLFRVRSRPAIRFFRQRNRRHMYILLYFSIWLLLCSLVINLL